MEENRYAVLIGCNKYPDDPEKLPSLKYAENDAKGLQECLIDKDIGSFDPNNVTLFNNQPHREVLKEVARCLDNAQRDDMVLLYFSGHGKLDSGNRLHLATSNTTSDLLGVTSIPVQTIKELIDRSGTEKIIVILDCCYSGAIGAAFKGGDVDSELQIASGGKGKYIMTASTGIQVAEEKEGDNYSVFTNYLLEGLRTGDADLNGDGEITADELYTYVRDRVVKSGKQEPMKYAIGVTGDLRIAGAKQPQKLRARFLANLYAKGELSLEEYNFAVGVVTSKDTLTDEQNRFVELMDGVIAGADASGCAILIRTLWSQQIQAEKVKIRQQAETYRRKDMYRKALNEWQKILDMDAADTQARTEIEELTKIIEKEQNIKDHAKLAKKYSEGGKHLDAIVEWVEVLRLDCESENAINGIKKNLDNVR